MQVRTITIGVVLAAAVVLLVATGASAAPATGGRPTNVNIVEPFQPDGSLKPRLRVVRSARGSCFTGSVADPSRPDAWRCTVGNLILDPASGRRSPAADSRASPLRGTTGSSSST